MSVYTKSLSSSLLPFVMWGFPIAFFSYQFILRLWPGLMMDSIMEQFAIDASRFGLLASFYYYGYAGMQIPVAILLDRFGPPKILCLFALLCGFATLAFSLTDSFTVALISRFLVGAGSAVGFLGVSKVISLWFPKAQYARMIGLSFTVGLLGAIYGGKPVGLLIDNYGGQSVAVTLSFVALALGVASYFALQVSPPRALQHEESSPFNFSDFKALLTSPLLWCLAIGNLLMVGSLEGFADVWGIPYLMTAYGIAKSDAAGIVSFVFFGMLFGGPLLAFVGEKIGNYRTIAFCGIGMAVALLVLFSMDTYHSWSLVALFFGIGVLCCYQVIVFAAGSDFVDTKRLGVTIAFLNCINMLGGSFFHTAIGRLMDFFWTGGLASDTQLRIYDLTSYHWALSVIPLSALAGAGLVSFVGLRVRKSDLNLSR